jgi:hypothetical protein
MMLSLAVARKALAVAAAAGALGLVAVPRQTDARELALAQGTIAISEPPAGSRAPACGELMVEARDALDDHLIGRTQPAADADGACRYAISVPAQSAVWLRLRPALVAGERITPGDFRPAGAPATHGTRTQSSRSVALRFTIIAPATYFFAPGEQKTIPLAY